MSARPPIASRPCRTSSLCGLTATDDEIRDFFNEHGYVVLDNVLTGEEVAGTVDEMWSHEDLLAQRGVKRDDPRTWNDEQWPAIDKGFLGSRFGADEIWSWKNRGNERVIRCFEAVLGTGDLLVNLDRYGIMRPTRAVPMPSDPEDGAGDRVPVDRPEWQTPESWLHVDQHPFHQPGFVGVQGLLALSDQSHVSAGGFCCVPGFHRQFASWAERERARRGDEDTSGLTVPYPFDEEDPAQSSVQPILLKSGSLVIWDSRLPHQSFPNTSSGFRIVQYVTYSPAADAELAARFQRGMRARVSQFACKFVQHLSERGRQVCGLESSSVVAAAVGSATGKSTEEEEAIAWYHQGLDAEANGDRAEAVRCFSKSFCLCPSLVIDQ